jgi:CRISPR-associated protein Csh2
MTNTIIGKEEVREIVERIISNRREVIFLYDITNNNPNGDPNDENKVRMDNGRCMVTNVRLKRTIRDSMMNAGELVFVWTEKNSDGKLITKEEKVELNKITSGEVLLEKYIDMRLFGACVAMSDKKKKGKNATDKTEGEISKQPIKYTGPVQFGFGNSMHKVEMMTIKGTTIFPSKDERATGTFSWKYMLPYALISFHGIVNEHNARITGMTEGDLSAMYEHMWEGTKGLLSCSKKGQMPRAIIEVVYYAGIGHIGDLDKELTLVLDSNEVEDETEIRGTKDYFIDAEPLMKVLGERQGLVKEVNITLDRKIRVMGLDKAPEGLTVNIVKK